MDVGVGGDVGVDMGMQTHNMDAQMPKHALESLDDDGALLAVCGSDSMFDRVKRLWEEMLEKKRLDVSGRHVQRCLCHHLVLGLSSGDVEHGGGQGVRGVRGRPGQASGGDREALGVHAQESCGSA